MNEIKLICFDLGGVLVRVAKGWEEACGRVGLSVPRGDFKTHHELICAYESGALEEAVYVERTNRCFDGMTDEVLGRIFDAWLMGVYPGVAELLGRLKEAGMPTACLSNTNPRHWRVMRGGGEYAALEQLDYAFASYLMKRSKPDPLAYRHVEEQTGIKGREILFFDDRPENIAAAAAAGWQAKQVDPSRGAEEVAGVVERVVFGK